MSELEAITATQLFEVISATQLLDACIGNTKTIIDIGHAVHDAQGLPPKLRALFEQLPAIENLLESAHENCEAGQVAEDARKTAEPILKHCEQALGELRDIIRKACPKDSDNRGKRVWKGAKTVSFARNSHLEKLLKTIQDNLRLLEQHAIYVIDEKLDELPRLTETLTQDDSGKYLHTGAGSIIVNEGGRPTNNVVIGEYTRQINNAGVYNEASM